MVAHRIVRKIPLAGVLIVVSVLASSASASAAPPRTLELYFRVPQAPRDTIFSVARTMLARAYATKSFSRRTCKATVAGDTVKLRLFRNTRSLENLRDLFGIQGGVRVYYTDDEHYISYSGKDAPSGYTALQDLSGEWHSVKNAQSNLSLNSIEMRIEKFNEYTVFASLVMDRTYRKNTDITGKADIVTTVDGVIYGSFPIEGNIYNGMRVAAVVGCPMTKAYIMSLVLRYPMAAPVQFTGGKPVHNVAHWLARKSAAHNGGQ